MYDDLEKRIEKASALTLKNALCEELAFQQTMPDNGAWLHYFLEALKGGFVLGNGDMLSLIEKTKVTEFKECLLLSFKRQKCLMENRRCLMSNRKSQRTNSFRPFCSLIWAVLERTEDGN